MLHFITRLQQIFLASRTRLKGWVWNPWPLNSPRPYKDTQWHHARTFRARGSGHGWPEWRWGEGGGTTTLAAGGSCNQPIEEMSGPGGVSNDGASLAITCALHTGHLRPFRDESPPGVGGHSHPRHYALIVVQPSGKHLQLIYYWCRMRQYSPTRDVYKHLTLSVESWITQHS